MAAGFDISPASGKQGAVVNLTIASNDPYKFRATSAHRAYFMPNVLPAGVAAPPGAAGTIFFGYPCTFHRVDDKHATVVVPPMGTNPLVQMVPGDYRILVTTSVDLGWGRQDFKALAASAIAAVPLSGPMHGAAGAIPTVPATPSPAAAPVSLPGPGLPLPHSIPVVINPGAAGTAAPPGSGAPIPALILTPHTHGITLPISTTSGPGPGSGGGGAGTAGAAGSSTTSGSGASAQPAECFVRWLVEDFTPLRTDSPSRLVKLDHLKSDLSLPDGAQRPIKRFACIVSAQLLQGDLVTPIKNTRMTLRFMQETTPSGDDSRILEVSEKFDALQMKLKQGASGSGKDFAYSNSDGKVYCWYEIALLDNTDPSQRLKGIKAIIGENTAPQPGGAPPSGLLNPLVIGQSNFTEVLASGVVEKLWDMFVEPATPAIVTAVMQNADTILEAHAGVKRRTDEMLGFALRRFADGLILSNPAGALLAAVQGITDLHRSVVLGGTFGMIRGCYVMGRDNLEDIANLVRLVAYDMPRALYDFFSHDTRFRLEVVASLASPITGEVIYRLDPDFKKRVDEAMINCGFTILSFLGKMEDVRSYLLDAWNNPSSAAAIAIKAYKFAEQVGNMFWESWDKFVGFIPVDYLKFKKESNEYQAFLAAFIVGDVLGYVVGTVALEAAMGVLTAGIGTVLAAAAKLGRVAAVAQKFAHGIEGLVKLLQRLWTAIKNLAGAARDMIGRAIGYLFKLFGEAAEIVVGPMLDGIFTNAEKGLRMLVHYGDGHQGSRITAIAEGLADGVAAGDATAARAIKETTEALAEMADFPGARRFVCGC